MLAALVLSACSSDETLEPDNGTARRQAKVTLLATYNGMGDNGYIDSSVEGVFAFAFQTQTPMQLLLPESKQEAEQMYKQWLSENADRDSSVIILGTEDYQDFAGQMPQEITGKGTRVLLYESTTSEHPDGVSSIFINRYGAAYLCGAMSGILNSFIIAATPGYNTLQDAINGFMDGYEAHHEEGKTAELVYLANGEEGFAMPDSAYHLLSRRMDDFYFYNEMVFPLLGGSGIGVIRCMNDNETNLGLIIGMDVDQSAMSPRVPFSLVVKTGEVIHRYLDDWLAGKEWPKHHKVSMSEGGADVILHPEFYERQVLTLGYYSDPNTFANRYYEYRDEAIRKEEEHENKL